MNLIFGKLKNTLIFCKLKNAQKVILLTIIFTKGNLRYLRGRSMPFFFPYDFQIFLYRFEKTSQSLLETQESHDIQLFFFNFGKTAKKWFFKFKRSIFPFFFFDFFFSSFQITVINKKICVSYGHDCFTRVKNKSRRTF